MGEAAQRPAWPLAALALLLAASALLVHQQQQRGWSPRLGFASFTALPQQPAPETCRHWAAADRLAGGCVAEQQPSATPFTCCGNSGQGFGCRECPPHLLQTLQCIAPRYLLFHQTPGCEQLLRPPPLPPPLPARPVCPLPSAAVLAGSWVPAQDTVAATTPAAPGLVFQAGTPCARRRPVGGAEVPACLWAAGIDRVVVSGDSTTRQLYTRLVGLVRQQAQVFDAGASLVYSHYALTARWPPAAGDGGGGGSSSSSPVVTDALWISPPGNILPGWFNDTAIADGLLHFIRRSAAARAAAEARAAAGRPTAQLLLDFVLGSHAVWQQRHVRAYMGAGMSGDPAWRRRALLVLSLCIWEDKVVWPEGWLQFLADMRQQVGMVALVTCPLERLKGPLRDMPRDIIGRRNEQLRQMVAAEWGGSAAESGGGSTGSNASSSGGGGGSNSSDSSSGDGGSGAAAAGLAPLLLLDLDAMTQEAPQIVTLSPMDHHYQCYPSSLSKYENGSLLWSGGDGAAAPWYPLRRFDHAVVAGTTSCADPVNYAAWQLLLSMLCNK